MLTTAPLPGGLDVVHRQVTCGTWSSSAVGTTSPAMQRCEAENNPERPCVRSDNSKLLLLTRFSAVGGCLAFLFPDICLSRSRSCCVFTVMLQFFQHSSCRLCNKCCALLFLFRSVVRVNKPGDPHAKLRGPETVLQGLRQGLQVHAGEGIAHFWFLLRVVGKSPFLDHCMTGV